MRLPCLTDVGGLSRDVERSFGEAEAKRCVFLCQEADSPHDLEKLGSVQPQFMLVGLGKELLVVRKSAFDQA